MSFNCKGIVQRGTSLLVEDISLPELQAHQVYVQVENAAFNPTDRLAFDLEAFGDGAVLGCDSTGIVTHLHPSVTNFAVGDRIGALVWGGEIKAVGAYATHCIADERIAFKVPETITSLASCSIPLAVNTAWLALFSSDCLALDRHAVADQPSLLVWGGSSAVGYYAIQLAHLHGITVATTCSPRNFDFVKEAGATFVFDYNDPDVIAQIQAALPTLEHVLDTIGNVSSSATSTKAIGTRAGTLCTVRPGKANTGDVLSNIKVTDVFVFTAFPHAHTYRGLFHWPIHQENHELSQELYLKLPNWLLAGSLKPLPTEHLGSLSPVSVKKAMEMNRTGQVSGRKLCFSGWEV